MSKLPTLEEMAKDVVDRAMQEINANAKVNGMTISEFIENVNNAAENENCNFATCRYNKDGKCKNEEKRKECVEVSGKVLCLNE